MHLVEKAIIYGNGCISPSIFMLHIPLHKVLFSATKKLRAENGLFNFSNSLKEAFSQGLLDSESVWLDMIEQRNQTSHVYDENQIVEILDKLKTE